MSFGMTIKEAKKTLEDVGLTLKLNVETDEGIDKSVTIVKEQTPKKGIKAEKSGYVMCEI